MKKYTFQLEIFEGSDEWWEELTDKGNTGCDEIKEVLKDLLSNQGFFVGDNCELKLTKYEDK